MNTDKIGIRGIFRLSIFNAAGDLLSEYEDENLVVNGGKRSMAMLLAGDAAAASGEKTITTISFGTNGTPPALTDTVIATGFEKTLAGSGYPSPSSVQFNFTLELAENNGVTIAEFGLLDAEGALFARKIHAGIAKTSDVRLSGTWTITFP